jgi:Asp/Glu/hydantoin racemase
MRILLLNPNMTQAVTDRLATAAAAAASPGTEIIPATAPRGFPYISCKAEAQIAGAIVLEMLAERQGAYDAAIVAAFGDPGLFAARELFDRPVVGMSEAAMLTACMLGKRFGIVSFAAQMEAWYAECVESHGLTHRCAGIFCLKESFGAITSVAEEKADALVALAGEAVAAGSDVVILAGAPLAGLAADVAHRIAVPVIDQAQAALRQAETLALLRSRKAEAGRFRRPPPKDSSGLPAALAARIAHRD